MTGKNQAEAPSPGEVNKALCKAVSASPCFVMLTTASPTGACSAMLPPASPIGGDIER